MRSDAPPLQMYPILPAQPHDLSWRTRLVQAWESIQVELHGCYSIERLRTLQGYSQRTTPTRIVLVLVLTPLPCLVAVAFADCIPLEPPELGISHSGGFWIRACFATWVYSYSILEQLRFFIPGLPLTGWITLAMSIPVMALTIACTFALADTVGYPIPFTIPVLSIPFAVFMGCALGLRLRTYLRDHPTKRQELVRFLGVMMCQLSLLFVYPAFYAVFYKLSSKAQALFALLLPVIKLVEKNIFGFFMRNTEDLRPEHIIFNVEIFNALFIACCMQNSNSIATNFVLVAVDFVMACISLRDLDAILADVHVLSAKMNVDASQLQDVVLLLCQQHPQLESQATQKLYFELSRRSRSWSQAPSRLRSHTSRRVSRLPRHSRAIVPSDGIQGPSTSYKAKNVRRLWGSLPTRFSWRTSPSAVVYPVHKIALNPVTGSGGNVTESLKLGAVSSPQPLGDSSSRTRSTIASTLASLGALKMFFPDRVVAEDPKVSPARIESRLVTSVSVLSEEDRVVFLQKMLQTLHLTEYLLLIEYVEVMIPIVYSIYLFVLFHLPNRTYYPQLRNMDEHILRRTIGNVMMNAVFEFASLLLLVRVLRRRLHMSPLRQLSFVLDRQWPMVQSKVVLWVVVTLQSTLYHLGADYSFKFAWLHHN